MSNYLICTDSTTDLPAEYFEKHNITTVALSYIMDGKTYSDDETTITRQEFYDKMRKGAMTQTSQINAEDFVNAIEPLVEKGNDILFIAFSSGLSGSYQSCCIGAEQLLEKYPERKILVVDSLCASLGEGLLLDYAIKNKANGMSIEDNLKWVEDNKLHLCHWFTVDSLEHLHRMGRVSKTSAILGSLIGIKPVLHVDNDGKLIMVSKSRGRAASINMLVENMAKHIVNPENQTIFISHGDCICDAKILADKIEKRFGLKPEIINYVGAVIGSHSGPGTLALFFVGDVR